MQNTIKYGVGHLHHIHQSHGEKKRKENQHLGPDMTTESQFLEDRNFPDTPNNSHG